LHSVVELIEVESHFVDFNDTPNLYHVPHHITARQIYLTESINGILDLIVNGFD